MGKNNRKKRERIFILCCTAAIALSSTLLYFSLSEKSESTTKQIAIISFKRKTAQRKLINNPTWELLYKDSPVYNKDKIRTSEDSLSIVYFENKDELELDENTFVYLEMGENGTIIDFVEGNIYARRGVDDSALIIKTEETTIHLNGADVALTKKTDGEVTIDVHSGSVDIISGDKTKTVARDESVVIKDKSITLTKKEISIQTPSNNRYFITSDDKKEIEFKWKGGEGSEYIFHYAKKKDFSDERTLKTSDDTLSLKLDKGEYYWKITDDDKKKSTLVGKVTVLRDSKPHLLLPEWGEEISVYSDHPRISFSWGGGTLPSFYLLEIFSDKELKEKIFEIKTKEKSIDVDTLAHGSYYWQVTAFYTFAGSRSIVSSDTSLFSITKSETIASPRLIKPDAASLYSSDYFKKNRLLFNWTNNGDIADYEIEISQSLDFGELFFKKKTSSSSLYVDKHFPPGTYYWRLRYYDNAQKKHVISDINNFVINEETTITPISPAERSEISEDETIRLRWKDSSDWNRYRVELASDHEFIDVRESITTRSDFADVHVTEGSYFWRISRLDDKERPISTFTGGTFAVKPTLDSKEVTLDSSRIVINYPTDGSRVDMSKKSSIKFRWKADRSIKGYKIRLTADGKEIFNIKTSKNYYLFSNLKKMHRGTFQFSIQADAKTDTTYHESISFLIYLKPLKKPGLLTDEIIISE